MTAYEFREQMVYDSLVPSAEVRASYEAALICTTVANSFRGKGSKAKLKDYLLTYTSRLKALARGSSHTNDVIMKLKGWLKIGKALGRVEEK